MLNISTAKRQERWTYTQYAIAVAKEAVSDSGLDVEKEDLNRIGVIFGAGIGGIRTFEEEVGNYALTGKITSQVQSVLHPQDDFGYCCRTNFYYVWFSRSQLRDLFSMCHFHQCYCRCL